MLHWTCRCRSLLCILNTTGRVVIEAEVPSKPTALAAFIHTHAPSCVRVGLESGPTASKGEG